MIESYLSRYSTNDQITIIGPLLDENSRFTEPIIFVDGGTLFKKHPQMGFSIGDGDSAPLPLDQKLNPDKDFSDLSFVLNKLTENFRDIALKGILGGRIDHELINLAEIRRFIKTRSNTTVNIDNQIKAKSSGRWEFHFEGVFSLFSFEDNLLHLSGACKYPLNSQILSGLSSHGLSNEAKGLIKLENNKPIFIFLNN